MVNLLPTTVVLTEREEGCTRARVPIFCSSNVTLVTEFVFYI